MRNYRLLKKNWNHKQSKSGEKEYFVLISPLYPLPLGTQFRLLNISPFINLVVSYQRDQLVFLRDFVSNLKNSPKRCRKNFPNLDAIYYTHAFYYFSGISLTCRPDPHNSAIGISNTIETLWLYLVPTKFVNNSENSVTKK